jgi:hypothetical protein
MLFFFGCQDFRRPSTGLAKPLVWFAGYLRERNKKRHDWLKEPLWLVSNFAFDDECATYAPRDDDNDLPEAKQSGYMRLKLARN